MYQVGDLVHTDGDRYCVVVVVGKMEGYGTSTSVWGCWEDSEEEAISSFEDLEERHKKPLSSGGKLGYATIDRGLTLIRPFASHKDTEPKSFMSFMRKMDKEYNLRV